MIKIMSPAEWFKKLMISGKIVALYIPLIVIPLFLLGYISNLIFTQVIVDKTITNVTDESKLIITRLNVMMDNSKSCANVIMTDLNKIIEMNKKNIQLNKLGQYNQISYLAYREQVLNQLSFIQMAFPDIDSIAFIDNDSVIYGTDMKVEANAADIAGSNILNVMDKTNGVNVWFPMQERDYLVMDKTQPVLTLGKKILDINTQEKLGTLIINISEKSLSSVYDDIGQTVPNVFFLLDQQGTVVSSLDKTELLKPLRDDETRSWLLSNGNVAVVRNVKGKRTLITSMLLDKTGWRLVNEIPLEKLTADTDKLTLAVILIGCICLIFAVFGAGILAKTIVNPLTRLTKSMLIARQGNLDIECSVESQDEVGMLASGFNTMIVEIKNLLEKVRQEQRKKREYELALIQAQIKPHFLYNTLDVIYALAKMERLEQVQEATKSLADFYRAALSKGREIITIREEVGNVKAYLAIQRIRYSDVFDYEINIPDDIQDYDILKLTIQPLVENSIYHGLKVRTSPGKILIEGFKTKNEIVIRVVDDGVGMPRDLLLKVLHQDNVPERSKPFGLSSVNERIKLYFGEDYGISIRSEEGSGTEVSLRLPL
jgi:two-component system, sensor histidine kinase YesM